jgi:hypothetical protein
MADPEYGSSMMRFLLLALLALSPACEKEEAPAQSKIVATVDLGDVVGTLQLPAGDNLDQLAPVIDSVQPGASAMLGAQIPMLLAKACGLDLSAADLSKPVSLVVLNPKKYPDPIAVLVSIEDRKKLEAAAKQADRVLLESDGLALLGPAAVVEAAKGFAFGSLATPSKSIHAIAYPAPLNAIYKKEMSQGIDSMAKSMGELGGQGKAFVVMMKLYQKALGALAEQSDRIELSVESQSVTPSLLFKIVPIKGTTMAAFVDAQGPAEHKLLAKLPATDEHGVVFSGVMVAGAARKAVIDFGVEAMKAIYKSDELADFGAKLGPWFDAFDGHVAMTMSMNLDPSKGDVGAGMNYLMGSTDTEAMRKGWHEMFDILAKASDESPALDIMGVTTRVQINKNVFQAEGVEVDHYQSVMSLDELPPAQRASIEDMGMTEQNVYFAAFDKVAAVTSHKDGQSSMTSLVAAARAKQSGFQAPPGLAKALDVSRARKESLVMYMDVASLMPAGAPSPLPLKSVVMGMGSLDGALVMRFSVDL